MTFERLRKAPCGCSWRASWIVRKFRILFPTVFADAMARRPIDEYFVLVWMPSGNAIVPCDTNPGQEDEGMLVYRSRSAAEAAATHQQEMYGDDETATAIPLSQLGLNVRETEAL